MPSRRNSILWTSGQIKFGDGSTQSISAGSFTNLSVGKHYVYAIEGTGQLFQTTDYSVIPSKTSAILSVFTVSTEAGQTIGIEDERNITTLINREHLNPNSVEASAIEASSIMAKHLRANIVVVGSLASGVNSRLFSASSVQDNIEAWRHSSDITKIDGGDIYTQSIYAKSGILAGSITASEVRASSIKTQHLVATQIYGKDFRTASGVGQTGGGAGIRLYRSGIEGYSGGTTKEFYGQTSDGKFYAGGGNVILSRSGIKINQGWLALDGSSFYIQGSGNTFLITRTTNTGGKIITTDYMRDLGNPDSYWSVGLKLNTRDFKWYTFTPIAAERMYLTTSGVLYIDGTYQTFSPSLPDEYETLISRIREEVEKPKAPRNEENIRFCPLCKKTMPCGNPSHQDKYEKQFGKDISFLSLAVGKTILNLNEKVNSISSSLSKMVKEN